MHLDVLFLFPGSAGQQGFATIIWFHPGNFTTGSPSIWNPHSLVFRQRVIVVTVAWRMNIMGFFSTNDGEAPGNFGLMDQQAAMKWVKNNIKLFGGNPDNICLMGYGTGAVSVGLHMINPESRGLFHKAIAMSGNIASPTAVKHASEDKSLLDRLAYSFACIRRPTSKLIDCLRNADAKQLVEQTTNVDWRPVLDAGLSNNTPPFIPDVPRNYFERGDFHKVPFLTGYTNMESVLEIQSIDNETIPINVTNEYLQQLLAELINADIPPINNTDSSCTYNFDHIVDSVMFFYGPTNPIKDQDVLRKIIADFLVEKNYAAATYLHAKLVSQHQRTYMYRFDMKPTTLGKDDGLPDWVSVPHLYDLIYVWGVPYWGTKSEWDIRDKRVSDTIMSFWTNFAKYSDPTESTIYPVKWETFSEENPGVLIVDSTFNMSNIRSLNYKAFEFWNDYYPKVLDIATQCCGTTESSARNYHLHYILVIFTVISCLVLKVLL